MPKAKTKTRNIPLYKQNAARFATLKLIETRIKNELTNTGIREQLIEDFKRHGSVEQVKDSKGNPQFDDRGDPVKRYKIEINALGFKNVTLTTEYKDAFERVSVHKAGEKNTIRKTEQNTDEIEAMIQRILAF